MTTAQSNKRIGLKHILFLTDFSEPSGSALPFASTIARAYGSVVYALHVLLPSAYAHVAAGMAGPLLDGEENRARAEMRRVEAELMGIPHEAIIGHGVGVWPVLADVLKDREIDLIVLGTHGRTGLQKLLLGSSAEEVFRRARVPVLTIGPTVRSGAHNSAHFRFVLFATDFHPNSLAAAPYAVSLAQENQARLVLLHVLPKPRRGKTEKSEELSVAEAIHRLQALVPEGAESWCRPEAIVQHGEPGEQILATANQCGADLVVLGVRGIAGFAGMTTRMERATAHKVVVRAPCPVLTVRS